MRIAFPFTLVIFALLNSVPSFSQFRIEDSIVYLNYNKTKEMLNEPLACQSYTVIDNRIDSTAFISTIISDKGTPLKLRFETNPATSIENYISRITRDLPHGGSKDLVISLRRYIMAGHRSFYFTADAYQLEPDQRYIKVCTIDTAFEKHTTDFLAGKAIALLIERFNQSTDTVTKSTSRRYTLQEIKEDKVYKSWGKYPIIHDTNAYTGIYLDAIRMKNDELEKMEIQLTMNSDSSYHITIPDSSDNTKKMLMAWLRNSRPLFKYQGTVYIKYYDPIVPLTIRNNTFYMHLPEGYPNFFSYDLYRNANTMRSRSSSMPNFKDLVNDLVTKLETDPVLKHGMKAKDCRDSYLDIEKNILVYY